LEKIEDTLNYKLLLVKTGACYIRDKREFWERNFGFSPRVAEYLRENFPNHLEFLDLIVSPFHLFKIDKLEERHIGLF